ncbi:MAG: zf-TFIIB domain-containing protein [Candidatus Krumholzibacteriia bacterium]|nr:zf-TFIIB domain-containing protein [bacterium]MCB9515449.1 zf-TFIIB domain-containing protein [Candidatus Latescibacterota bacterium]
MKCPACGNALTEITVGGIQVDVCRDGCGGTWFDWFELQKFDEPDEDAGERLLHVRRDPTVRPDTAPHRKCPRCDGQPMQRHFFSVKREVEVDECPACGGYWLDAEELEGIRNLFGSEEEARETAREFFDALVDVKFADERAKSQEQLRKARRFAHLFRFICPSYWIPGKQEWGAH